MSQNPRFLTVPLWQQVKLTYRSIATFHWRKLWQNTQSRRVIQIALSIIALYIAIVSVAAIGIYRYKANNAATRFAEHIFPYPAAIVNGHVIWLSRYRVEVAARTHYSETHQLTTTKEDTAKFVIKQLVDRTLYQQALTEHSITLNTSNLQSKLQEIYDQVGGEDKLTEFLTEQYGPEVSVDLFKTWMKEAAIENAVQSELLTRVTVRHILVAVSENATPEQVDAAKAKAQEIKDSITDVSQFADVAKARSEDVASRDKGGEFGTTNRGDDSPVLSQEFEDTIFSLPVGQVSNPIRTPYGWDIVTVDEHAGTVDLSKKAYTASLEATKHVNIFIGI